MDLSPIFCSIFHVICLIHCVQNSKGIPSPMKDFSRLSVASMCAICISIRPFKYTQTAGNLFLLNPASPCVVESLDRAEFDNATCTVSLCQTKRWSQVQIYCRFKHFCQSHARELDTVTKPPYSRIVQRNPKEGQSCITKKKNNNTNRLGIAISRGEVGKVLIHFPLKNSN